MNEKIEVDDPKYASKHAALIGFGWYFLFFLLVLAWASTFVMMFVVKEFSIFPILFFIMAWAVIYRIGTQLTKNGYITDKVKRQELIDAKKRVAETK